MMNTFRRVARYVYWTFGILLLMGTTYFIYNVLERPVAGVLVFIGMVLALYFYYTKWFIMSQSVRWPPYQTPCPDYLTMVVPGKDPIGAAITGGMAASPTQYKCVDFVGVSTTGTLKRSSPGSVNTQMNDPQYTLTIDPAQLQNGTSVRSLIDSHGLSWTSLIPDTR